MSDNFMEPEITDKMYWLEVNGSWCNEYIPEDIFDCEITQLKEYIKNCEWEKLHDLIKDYTENTEIWEAKFICGYGVRSSAPGYMDCTSWTVYTNKKEALSAYRVEQKECSGIYD